MAPLAIFHCPIQIIKRSKGRTVVEAAAYRSGGKLYCDWNGVTYDYSRKGGVVHTEILLPSQAPREYLDRATLWNSVEAAETASNAQLAREVEAALPRELNREEQLKLVREFVKNTFVDAGMCADFALHDKGDGNPHVHILLTMRPINQDGTWGAKSKKVYVLDKAGNKIPDGHGGWKNKKEDLTGWNDRGNAEKWRAEWARYVNQALEEKGVSVRVDHRSYKRQGIERIPGIHMGPAAMRMEKKGIRTDRGDINREIAANNKLLNQLKARITRLYTWSKELAAREEKLSGPKKESVMAQLMNAQLERQKERAAVSRYAAANSIQDNAAVLNFLLDYNINSVSELFDAITELNSDYYELRGRMKKGERRMTALRERMEKLEIYNRYKALRQKADKLNPRKRAAFEEQHRSELAQFEAAKNYLQEMKNGGEKISMQTWRKELDRLKKESYGQEYELKRMAEQIKTAEHIRKDAERIMEQNQQEEERRKSEPSL